MNGFKELGISDSLVEALKKQGITVPTPIQEESIGLVKNGIDIIGEAQTGTGKTLAFLLPMFENFLENSRTIQGLIVSPTRELALQITEEAEKLCVGKKLNVLSAYGGKDIEAQLKKLDGRIDLIIATPGRLIDHLSRYSLKINKLKTLVLDEADLMLKMGFREYIDAVMREIPKERQTLYFSATMDAKVKKLAYMITKNPRLVKIQSKEVTLKNITQHLVETTNTRKIDDLCQVLNMQNPFMAIIFCGTKQRVNIIEEELYRRGYNCQKLHGDLPQAKREKVIKSFKNTEIQYLVATDIAARGLDIGGVTHVYNYDFPETLDWYIHRIGRTGRAGEKGSAYLFVTKNEENLLNTLQKQIRLKLEGIKLENKKEVQAENQSPKKKYNKRVNTNFTKFNHEAKDKKIAKKKEAKKADKKNN